MEELYEIIYSKTDSPLYLPKLQLGNLKVGDIIDSSNFYSTENLTRKILSFRVDQIFESHQMGNKILTKVFATVV